MTEPSRAVFLSYASEDTEAAQRICAALRGAGIEVWFDQSELRGGDVWDRQIRKQIHDCSLFVPIISAHSQARLEGYFRREWKLAAERTHDMAEEKAFLVPVVIDGTSERGASVPDKFREVQWTRLTAAETPHAFVARVSALLSEPVHRTVVTSGPPSARGAVPAGTLQLSFLEELKRRNVVGVGILFIVSLALALTYFVADRFWLSKSTVKTGASTVAVISPAAAPLIFAPPPRSIAVLPFTNLSGDPKEEYFSDGVSEELINALSQIDALRVAARTSSFSFKGKDVDIRTIARTLDVASILEGSIRRSGNEVRITAELINAVSGFHIWSKEYDRDLKNILSLQTDIATSVAGQLQARLLGDESAKIEEGGTHNPQAYDAYLRGRQRFESSDSTDEPAIRASLAWYDQAISLDPNYAAAYAQRARMLSDLARFAVDEGSLAQRQELFRQAREAAEKAVTLAPSLADGHVALGWHVLLFGYFDFQGAAREIERAMSLAPGNAYVLYVYGSFQAELGHQDTAIAAARRAVSLDPQNYVYDTALLYDLDAAHRFSEELAEVKRVRILKPDARDISLDEAAAYAGMGNMKEALKLCSSQSTPLAVDDRHFCLALAYHAVGRTKEAERELEALRALDGDVGALYYALIYAQWGEPKAAFRWLAAAERQRDPYLININANRLLDPIRKEPEFKALERRLNFPP